MKNVNKTQWWRLPSSPTKHNESLSMELLWAWEPTYRKELEVLIRAKDPSIVFLAETLADEARLKEVQRNINFDNLF